MFFKHADNRESRRFGAFVALDLARFGVARRRFRLRWGFARSVRDDVASERISVAAHGDELG